MQPQATIAQIVSQPIPLNPGIMLPREPPLPPVNCTEIVLRLLTHREAQRVEQEPEGSRENFRLYCATVRLGPLPSGQFTAAAFDQMVQPDYQRCQRALADLEASTAAPLPEPAACSEPVQLNPGVVINGERIRECRVRMLVKRDTRVVFRLPVDERPDAILLRSLVSFGSVEDRGAIEQAVDQLVEQDELRIHRARAALEKQYDDKVVEPEPDSVRFNIRGVDIQSEPFELDPGILIDGQVVKTCRVRLLYRGEWQQVDALTEQQSRDDLAFALSIAQLGSVDDRAVIRVASESMAMADVQRVKNEVAALQGKFPLPPDTTEPAGTDEAIAGLD